MLKESESIAEEFVFVTSQTNVALFPDKACCGVFDPGSTGGTYTVPATRVASEGVMPVAPVDCAQSSTQTVTPRGMPLTTACSLVPVSASPGVPPVNAISSPLSVLQTVPGWFWPVRPATLNAVVKFSVN